MNFMKEIKENVNADDLAGQFYISSVHLHGTEHIAKWNGLRRLKKKPKNDQKCSFLIIPPYYILLKILLGGEYENRIFSNYCGGGVVTVRHNRLSKKF